MKGRLNRWDNQVDLATLVVTMRDRVDYVPAVVPHFGGTVGRAFHGSIEALVAVGKGIVVAAVAVAPWLAILVVLGFPWWPRLWRAFKARKQPPPASPTPPAPVPAPFA